MQRYKDYSPTPLDTRGLAMPDRQEWLVMADQNRDSDALARSNFRTLVKDAEAKGVEHEVHRFGHWACGWFEILIVAPAHESWAQSWESALSDYPVASEEDYSELETEEAQAYWESMSVRARIEYMREHASDFECRDMTELSACARGKVFRGCASNLLG